MLNQIILVGRLTKEIESKEIDGKKVATATLAVQRSFKNEEGIYETDFIDVTLWNGIASNACEYCQKGDLLGIKGRIQSKDGKMVIIAEKVSFLASKKGDENEE